MKLTKEKAYKIWDAYFGEDFALDPFGYGMSKYEHGTSNKFSWTADHVWPKNPHEKHKNAKGGASVYGNLQPLSPIGNQVKSNYLQGVFEDEADKINFTISSIGTHEGRKIGRMKIKHDDGNYEWAYDEPEY